MRQTLQIVKIQWQKLCLRNSTLYFSCSWTNWYCTRPLVQSWRAGQGTCDKVSDARPRISQEEISWMKHKERNPVSTWLFAGAQTGRGDRQSPGIYQAQFGGSWIAWPSAIERGGNGQGWVFKELSRNTCRSSHFDVLEVEIIVRDLWMELWELWQASVKIHIWTIHRDRIKPRL